MIGDHFYAYSVNFITVQALTGSDLQLQVNIQGSCKNDFTLKTHDQHERTPCAYFSDYTIVPHV